MSSLWTPEGEHKVEQDQGEKTSPPDSGNVAEKGAGPGQSASSAEEFSDSELAELEKELLDAPVSDVIANHCYGLFQLAALHLSQHPAQLEQASLAIDAFGALVEGLGDRLGTAAPTLTEGLAKVRLAFVEIAKAQGKAPEAKSGEA